MQMAKPIDCMGPPYYTLTTINVKYGILVSLQSAYIITRVAKTSQEILNFGDPASRTHPISSIMTKFGMQKWTPM